MCGFGEGRGVVLGRVGCCSWEGRAVVLGRVGVWCLGG